MRTLQRAMILAAINAKVIDFPKSHRMRAVIADSILTSWHLAFIAKAHGGSDEFGNRWPPLAPETVRRKQRHSRAQYVDRRRDWAERRGQLVTQLIAGGMSSADARVKANSIDAWGIPQTEGRQPINIDTMRLEQSIDPGRSDHPDQIRDLSRRVVLGTRRPKARFINAQRRFKPTPAECKVWVKRATKIVRNLIYYEIASEIQ